MAFIGTSPKTTEIYGQDYLRKHFNYSNAAPCEMCGLDLKLHIYVRLDFDGFAVGCSMFPQAEPTWSHYFGCIRSLPCSH